MSRASRRDWIRAAAGSALAAGFGCAEPEQTGPFRKIKVAVSPRTAMSGLFTAIEKGYFTEAGLEVEPHTFARTPQMAPVVASGRLDACMAGMSSGLFNAMEAGAKIAIVAAREVYSNVCGASSIVFGRADLFPGGLYDLKSLAGRRVALPGPQTTSEFALDLLLESAGMSSKEIELIFLKEQEAAAALVSGRIDAFVTGHLENDPAVLSGKIVRGMSLADLRPGLQRSHILFGPTLLEGDVETGASFLEGYLRGAHDFANGYTPEFFNELVRNSGLDAEEMRAECRTTFVPDGSIDPESIELFVEWASRKGYCENMPPAAEMIDDRFIKLAQQRLKGRLPEAQPKT